MPGLFDQNDGDSKSVTLVQKQEYDSIDRLIKLAEMKHRGDITDKEFTRAKNSLGLGPTESETIIKVMKVGGILALIALGLGGLGSK